MCLETYFIKHCGFFSHKVEILNRDKDVSYILRLKPFVISKQIYCFSDNDGKELFRIKQVYGVTDIREYIVVDQNNVFGEISEIYENGLKYIISFKERGKFDIELHWNFDEAVFYPFKSCVIIKEEKLSHFSNMIWKVTLQSEDNPAIYLAVLSKIYYTYIANGAGT